MRLIKTTDPHESIRCSELFLSDARIILTNAATFITALSPASDFCEGIVFGQFHTVSQGRHLSISRGRHLVAADHEPWSPAAVLIGGVSHFPIEVPVDCTFLGISLAMPTPWEVSELLVPEM